MLTIVEEQDWRRRLGEGNWRRLLGPAGGSVLPRPHSITSMPKPTDTRGSKSAMAQLGKQLIQAENSSLSTMCPHQRNFFFTHETDFSAWEPLEMVWWREEPRFGNTIEGEYNWIQLANNRFNLWWVKKELRATPTFLAGVPWWVAPLTEMWKTGKELCDAKDQKVCF